MLNQQEKLCLSLIFRADDQLSKEILERVATAECVDREETGVGFYATVKLKTPLSNVPDIRIREYNFSHPSFPYGGSYMCFLVSENELELEAVTLGGADWPYPGNSDFFEELT